METPQEEKIKKAFKVKKTFKRKYLEGKGGKSYYLHNENKIFADKMPTVNIKQLKRPLKTTQRKQKNVVNKKLMDDIAKQHVYHLLENNINDTNGKISYLEKKKENKQKALDSLEEQREYLKKIKGIKDNLQLKPNNQKLTKGIQNQQKIIDDYKEQLKGQGVNFGKSKNQEIKQNTEDYGLELQDMKNLIIELLHNTAKNANIITVLKNDTILSDYNDKTQSVKIIIFLKSQHYTIAVKKNDYEFCYFNSLGNGEDQQQRFLSDKKQIQQYGFFISPEKLLKFKYNSVVWQDSEDKEENQFCGYYCVVWMFNYLILDEDFKTSTDYTLLDQEEMENINPYYQQLSFSFI